MFTDRLGKRHRHLLAMIRENWIRLAGAMACMLVMAATTSASAFLVKPVLDDIFFKKDLRMLRLIPLAILLIYFFRAMAYFGHEYLMNYVGHSIIRRLRDNLYDRIQDLSLSFFHKERTGVLMSRVVYDVSVVKTMVSTAVTGMLRDGFTIIGLIFVIFYREWKMALIALIILPAAFFPVVEFGRRVRRISTGCQQAMGEMSAFLHETFAGNKIVKAFGMESHEKKRFFEKTGQLFRLEMKSVVVKSLTSPIMELLGGLGVAFIIWYGGYRVITGSSTAGTFFSFLTAVLLLYDPVKKLSHLNNAIQQGLAAAERVYDIIELTPDIRERENPVEIPPGPHRVSFRDVCFGYDGEMVLHHVDLEVAAGEILAIVGMSGGGKTSLVHLIPRFYDVRSGAVFIDDVDIRQASLASLRRQIAVVTQEPILFNDTVRNNIAYGRPDATAQEIEKAARAAYAYDFIMGFPQKFETSIGELGGRLSGGEKQRICIARALLKDAPILILDEATSSLDAESERVVQKALENLMQGRTTFVIAHRLSTIGYAHRIVVMTNGRIAEEGSHEDLLCRGGEYFRLYRMQFEAKPQSHEIQLHH